MRTVVVRQEGFCETKVNDEIGLPPAGSYAIADYLQDLETYDGRKMIAQCGGAYAFSDGTVELLSERRESVPMEVLDIDARAIALHLKLLELPQLASNREVLAC